MLWVTCRHRGEPPYPQHFQTLEVTSQGKRKMYRTTGGIRDVKRGVSATNWPLPGGIEQHRGSISHIKFGWNDVAVIEVR
jgi:hypothetical protein